MASFGIGGFGHVGRPGQVCWSEFVGNVGVGEVGRVCWLGQVGGVGSMQVGSTGPAWRAGCSSVIGQCCW